MDIAIRNGFVFDNFTSDNRENCSNKFNPYPNKTNLVLVNDTICLFYDRIDISGVFWRPDYGRNLI